MKYGFPHLALSLVGVAVATLTACGGGGGGTASSGAATATTEVTVTVMDGLIRNALVCVDSNGNGQCDAGETQAYTDANGKVTLAIPTAALATTRLIAVVGRDATDADTGAVKTPYTMTAPAGKISVISPLTTMVQTKMDKDKIGIQAAESYVQSQTGLSISMFDDFIAKRASSSEHKKAGDIARLLVLSNQKSKETNTAEANSACIAGKSASEAEHIKDSNINDALVTQLADVRRTSDESERDDNDNDSEDHDDRKRQAADVVPICGTTTTTPTPVSIASALSGKTLYAANCSSCHGTNPSQNISGILKGANNPSKILSAISSNKGSMGYLSATIASQQATDISAYLANPTVASTTPAPAPAPAPTPTPTPTPASPTNGKSLYAVNCAACHGANPSLNGNKILKGASSAPTIESAISRNIGGMGFLSATINAQQAADLAAYLATPGI